MPVLLQLRLCPVVTDLGSFDLKQKSVIIGHDSDYQDFQGFGMPTNSVTIPVTTGDLIRHRFGPQAVSLGRCEDEDIDMADTTVRMPAKQRARAKGLTEDDVPRLVEEARSEKRQRGA
jgi:hypothetical protein